jgi:hypothetical protein
MHQFKFFIRAGDKNVKGSLGDREREGERE